MSRYVATYIVLAALALAGCDATGSLEEEPVPQITTQRVEAAEAFIQAGPLQVDVGEVYSDGPVELSGDIQLTVQEVNLSATIPDPPTVQVTVALDAAVLGMAAEDLEVLDTGDTADPAASWATAAASACVGNTVRSVTVLTGNLGGTVRLVALLECP